MNTTTAEITKEMINDCIPADPCGCPIHQALKVLHPATYLTVRTFSVHIGATQYQSPKRYQCSKELAQWQIHLMHRKPVSPITLTLDHKNLTIGISK